MFDSERVRWTLQPQGAVAPLKEFDCSDHRLKIRIGSLTDCGRILQESLLGCGSDVEQQRDLSHLGGRPPTSGGLWGTRTFCRAFLSRTGECLEKFMCPMPPTPNQSSVIVLGIPPWSFGFFC